MDEADGQCAMLPPTIPAQECPGCKVVRRRYVACLEVVLTGSDNHLRGIAARVRFAECWHVVKNIGVSVTDLARFLDEDDE